jgi:BirA family biotin operon repressor/biotin-[acetyl-CoA-carboxylase] ligase
MTGRFPMPRKKNGNPISHNAFAKQEIQQPDTHTMTPLFSTSEIARLCQPPARHIALEVVAETGSTNADLLARVGTLNAPTLLIAERQTAGRGRAGRTWYSAAGASLTFSLAWQFQRPLQDLIGLPLAVGVAIAEALAAQAVFVQLKWPNDILRDGKKLGGVLIATAAAHPSSPDSNWAVIGIGLNLTASAALEQQIGHAVADAPWLAQLDRNILMAALLNQLATTLTQFEASGLTPFISRWNQFHAHAGQAVAIIDHGQVLHQGRAIGIDAMGRLLLDTETGLVPVVAGDVSLRTIGTPGQ